MPPIVPVRVGVPPAVAPEAITRELLSPTVSVLLVFASPPST